jgi:hypothetical protein
MAQESENDCPSCEIEPAGELQRQLRHGFAAIIVSCIVISTAGHVFIFTYWQQRNFWIGVVRSFGFGLIMVGVHFVGYRLWKRQQETRHKPSTVQPERSLSSKHVSHGFFWLFVSLLILFLLLLALMC